jgi:hypothetical protein
LGQEFPLPLEDESEVVTDGAHDGVDLIAEAALEEVSAEMAVCLAVSDDGFDGGSPSEFLFDLAMNAALLAGFEDPRRVGSVVAAVVFVHIGPLDLAARSATRFPR